MSFFLFTPLQRSLIVCFFAVIVNSSCDELLGDDDRSQNGLLTVSTLAGSDSPGLVDGTGSDARFNYPCGIAVDALGNLYVADYANHSIRKVDPNGRVSIFAGTGMAGFTNGDRLEATFHHPYGLALDAQRNLYVSDVFNHAIRKISKDGMVSTLAGGNQGFSDRDGNVARFNHPHGITVDGANNVYVADAHNHRIRKITPEGLVSTVAGNGNDGYVDGDCEAAEFYVPIGIVADTKGNLYIGDEGNSSIRKISPEGKVSTLAGSGRFSFCDGVGTKAEFNAPGAIAMDEAGNLYVADYFNNCIRKVTPLGVVHKIAGNLEKGFADGRPSDAQFHYPFGIAVDGNGVVYVGDQFNHRIRKIN